MGKAEIEVEVRRESEIGSAGIEIKVGRESKMGRAEPAPRARAAN